MRLDLAEGVQSLRSPAQLLLSSCMCVFGLILNVNVGGIIDHILGCRSRNAATVYPLRAKNVLVLSKGEAIKLTIVPHAILKSCVGKV